MHRQIVSKWHGACLVRKRIFADNLRATYAQPSTEKMTMYQPFRSALSAAAMTLALGSGPALAHHAFAAEYDADQPLDLAGTVTKARWVNPHSWLYFDVKQADGSVTNWGVEFGAPNSLEGKGLSKADLQAGTHVRIQGFRSKNGGAFGYSVKLTLDDGRSFQTGGAPDTPPVAAN
jgi:Family of unknown function (DUF6152)